MSVQDGLLSFQMKETIFLSSDKPEIEELRELELLPDLEIRENDYEITICGSLQLRGKYVPTKNANANGGTDTLVSAMRFTPLQLEQGDASVFFSDEEAEIMHRIPISISVPISRTKEVSDIHGIIDSFDYEIKGPKQLLITADLIIDGIQLKNEQEIRAEQQSQKSPDTWEYIQVADDESEEQGYQHVTIDDLERKLTALEKEVESQLEHQNEDGQELIDEIAHAEYQQNEQYEQYGQNNQYYQYEQNAQNDQYQQYEHSAQNDQYHQYEQNAQNDQYHQYEPNAQNDQYHQYEPNAQNDQYHQYEPSAQNDQYHQYEHSAQNDQYHQYEHSAQNDQYQQYEHSAQNDQYHQNEQYAQNDQYHQYEHSAQNDQYHQYEPNAQNDQYQQYDHNAQNDQYHQYEQYEQINQNNPFDQFEKTNQYQPYQPFPGFQMQSEDIAQNNWDQDSATRFRYQHPQYEAYETAADEAEREEIDEIQQSGNGPYQAYSNLQADFKGQQSPYEHGFHPISRPEPPQYAPPYGTPPFYQTNSYQQGSGHQGPGRGLGADSNPIPFAPPPPNPFQPMAGPFYQQQPPQYPFAQMPPYAPPQQMFYQPPPFPPGPVPQPVAGMQYQPEHIAKSLYQASYQPLNPNEYVNESVEDQEVMTDGVYVEPVSYHEQVETEVDIEEKERESFYEEVTFKEESPHLEQSASFELIAEHQETSREPKEAVAKHQETVPELKEAVAKPQETVAEPKEVAEKRQETVPEPKEAVAKSQEIAPEPKEAVAKTQETVAEPKEVAEKRQ
ncbi:hypothetical protein, partial [Brevibacillus laterosporus]|uniref:hypothetical protein n=1 Tax=Brevibacillus laterosporus TaxID=1465 RepID=UPI000681A7D7